MTANNTKKVVYLVDDDEAVLDSLSCLLKSSGYAVNSFLSAEAFLENYDYKLSGCLILDVSMPFMNGLELQDNLLVSKINIPIIFISGHARVQESVKALRHGAIDFLEKPFETEILLLRIKEAIQKDDENRAKSWEHKLINQKIESLTAKEYDVLICLIKGFSNKEIAKMIDISPRTVEVHRAHIMEKMQVEHFTELLIMLKERL